MSNVICYKCNFSMSVLNHKPKRCPVCGFADSERCKSMLEEANAAHVKTIEKMDFTSAFDAIAVWLGVKK